MSNVDDATTLICLILQCVLVISPSFLLMHFLLGCSSDGACKSGGTVSGLRHRCSLRKKRRASILFCCDKDHDAMEQAEDDVMTPDNDADYFDFNPAMTPRRDLFNESIGDPAERRLMAGADADTWKSRRKSRDKSTYGRVKVHSQRSSKGEERKPSVAGESGNALAGMWSDSPYSAPESDKTADDGERMARVQHQRNRPGVILSPVPAESPRTGISPNRLQRQSANPIIPRQPTSGGEAKEEKTPKKKTGSNSLYGRTIEDGTVEDDLHQVPPGFYMSNEEMLQSEGCRRIMEKARQKVELAQQHKQKSSAGASSENTEKCRVAGIFKRGKNKKGSGAEQQQ